jgi:hypothetical protein
VAAPVVTDTVSPDHWHRGLLIELGVTANAQVTGCGMTGCSDCNWIGKLRHDDGAFDKHLAEVVGDLQRKSFYRPLDAL